MPTEVKKPHIQPVGKLDIMPAITKELSAGQKYGRLRDVKARASDWLARRGHDKTAAAHLDTLPSRRVHQTLAERPARKLDWVQCSQGMASVHLN